MEFVLESLDSLAPPKLITPPTTEEVMETLNTFQQQIYSPTPEFTTFIDHAPAMNITEHLQTVYLMTADAQQDANTTDNMTQGIPGSPKHDFNYDYIKATHQNKAPPDWHVMLQSRFTDCITDINNNSPPFPTFRRGQQYCSTLDFIFASHSLRAFLSQALVHRLHHLWSDHAPLLSAIHLGIIPRGKGFWRSNPRLPSRIMELLKRHRDTWHTKQLKALQRKRNRLLCSNIPLGLLAIHLPPRVECQLDAVQ
ncbi:hypothetical protein BDC45DRAFT_540328 [Circinella umbellata]|nr:hypothetical protein BDC45DRAFT_540328 [Circinella umbellata]